MSTQSTARRILRDASRHISLADLWVSVDELGLDAPTCPDLYEDGESYLVHLAVDTYSRTADLSVRWWRADDYDDGIVYQPAGAVAARDDITDATWGDESLRYITGVSRAARARLATIIESALRERGYDPTEYSIGGDPR